MWGRNESLVVNNSVANTCIAESFMWLRNETLTVERLTMINLRKDSVLSDEILLRLEHELDVKSLPIKIDELRVSSRQLSKKS